jgi:hypothetical protein
MGAVVQLNPIVITALTGGNISYTERIQWPLRSCSRATSSLSFFEVLALLEVVGHPPLGEPIKLASCVWE